MAEAKWGGFFGAGFIWIFGVIIIIIFLSWISGDGAFF